MTSQQLTLSRRTWGRAVVCLAACLGLSAPALEAQEGGRAPVVAKTSPRFLAAFRGVVARASRSTVRVRCDGRDVALGTVVGADGWILTKASELTGTPTVRLHDDEELPAQVVAVHQAHDLALLKVETEDLTPVVWRSSKEAPVGYWAVSVGPNGRVAAVGVVSVAARDLSRPRGEFGQSPTDSGYLGISLEPSEKEARVGFVVPGAGAAKAGLRVNDTILSVAGEVVRDGEMLLKVLQGLKPGDVIEVRIRRGDRELGLKAKLGKRPPDRGEMQNSLGSELSKRRSGFPTVLQHDSIVRPMDCGGPLVDLDGKVIGINICRAGRTESYAVPAEVVQPLLRDMRAGRYPPPAPNGEQRAARGSRR